MEGVGDLQVEKTRGNETDSIALKMIYNKSSVSRKAAQLCSHLPDPAFLDVILEGEPHDHGSEGVRVSQLRHCLDLKLLWKQHKSLGNKNYFSELQNLMQLPEPLVSVHVIHHHTAVVAMAAESQYKMAEFSLFKNHHHHHHTEH